MKQLNREIAKPKALPIRVLQFGEGNFLRGFCDQMIDESNQKGTTDLGIAIVKPINYGSLESFTAQDNLYTVLFQGQMGGETVNRAQLVTSITETIDPFQNYERLLEVARLDSLRIVISNTTESGIVFDSSDLFDAQPPSTFPGKLTRLLYERFVTFKGDLSLGLILIACELIEHNGRQLRDCVHKLIACWKLEDEFAKWVDRSCIFCSTLVDRIVTGYPRDSIEEVTRQLGYEDRLVTIAEPFGLWVIESPVELPELLPLRQAGLPVLFTRDQTPYRERKVRILNGSHIATVLAGYLAGLETVSELMKDSDMRPFFDRVIAEIVPTINLPQEEVVAFAQAVYERFQNPFLRHRLLDISLSAVAKWKARILPSFKAYYEREGAIPPLMTFSFAALLAFYRSQSLQGDQLTAYRSGQPYQIRDEAAVVQFFARHAGEADAAYAQAIAANSSFWGEDLSAYPQFVEQVAKHLAAIADTGMRQAVRRLSL